MDNIKIHNDFDNYIIKEIKGTYGWMCGENPKEDIIMDIGANIGCFAVYAGLKGFKKIYCYEPESSNFDLLKINASHLDNCELINKALLSSYSSDDEIDFYIPKSRKNMGSCSAYIKGGRDKVSVSTINFKNELDRIKPNIIKMDCEGAEYDLLMTELPDCVKKITMEIHLNKKDWRNNLAPKLIEKFKDWEAIKEPKITAKNWHTIAKYIRN
jgi:FkbM family methyltransferase